MGRKEGNVLFNNTLNTFYLRLYGVGHMVKGHSDSERGNLLPQHGRSQMGIDLTQSAHLPGAYTTGLGSNTGVLRYTLQTMYKPSPSWTAVGGQTCGTGSWSLGSWVRAAITQTLSSLRNKRGA